MTIQEWIVAVIVLSCAWAMVRWAIRFFRSAKNNDNPCAHCNGGCDLKRMMDDKQLKCREKQKSSYIGNRKYKSKADYGNKKCCG